MSQAIVPLLHQITLINKKYDEIAKITGEHFNIFRILKIESSEVRTHSAFLAELLNTKGSHNCDDLFIKLFINQQKEKNKEFTDFCNKLDSFVTSKAKASVESHIGFKNIDETEGGRIDILLQDANNNAIIIENKIYAGNQYNQLVRYNNAYKNAPIFYLTLDGKPPDKETCGNLINGHEYVCISYENDIITWLEACKEKTASLPILRETITQYIYLLKHLTHQSLNKNMSNEIRKSITNSSENFQAASAIANEMNVLLKSIDEDLLKRICQKLENKLLVQAEKDTNNCAYFFFFFEYSSYKFYLRIALEQGMSIWIAPYKEENLNVANDKPIVSLKKQLKDYPGIKSNHNYTGWIISKNDFTKYSIPDKYNLVNEKTSEEIVDVVVAETIDFIMYFKNKVKEANLQIDFKLNFDKNKRAEKALETKS